VPQTRTNWIKTYWKPVFTSLPDDLNAETARLNVEEEQTQVQEALMPWIAKGMIKLEVPDDGRFSTLKQLLKEFAPHLLFLSGHGKFHHQPHSDETPYGTFLFESKTGGSEPIRDTKITEALIGSAVQCVVVSACESGKAASDALNNGLTRKLGRLGLAYVIGMRESILDRAGILFARHFCDAVAGQERIDVALQQARLAISKPLKDIARREIELSGLSELSLG
jgi:CHAT domain-containing protein